MKSTLSALVLAAGLSAMTPAAWAQFLPAMDSAAVKAVVQQQLTGQASEQSIINAAAAAKVNPEYVIEALLALTPKTKAQDVVALLSKTYKDNPAVLSALASAVQRNTQLGLSGEQIRQIIATNSGNSDFALAGVAGANSVQNTGLGSVNNLFNLNSPAAGTGSGTAASPN
jgi:hypothetical protein